jgi:hypothetical protein
MKIDAVNAVLNTFTAIVDLSRFNDSCLKSPASTLVDLISRLPSFSLNQLTCHYTCTAASVYLTDVMFIPSLVYCAYILMLRGRVGCLWLQSIEDLLYVKVCMCESLYL